MSKKQQILDAYLEIISDTGYFDVPLRDIAKKADVALGSIYTYFGDKDQMLHTLYEYWRSVRAETVLSNDNEGLTAENRLKNFWDTLFNFYTKNPGPFEFLEQFKYSALYGPEDREEELRLLDPVITHFERGIAKGDYRYMNPVAMLYILLGHVAACSRLHLAGKVDVSEYQQDVLKQSAWDSLRAMKY